MRHLDKLADPAKLQHRCAGCAACQQRTHPHDANGLAAQEREGNNRLLQWRQWRHGISTPA
jgi:hypothetical protein